MNSTNIWNFQTQLSRRLIAWSLASILTGIPALFFNDLLRGAGIQFIAWGMIDLLIALFGMIGTNRRRSRLSPDEVTATAPKESASLKRILLINTGLDVLYITGGLTLAVTLGAENALWRGHGIGIVIQGGFLFFFDLYHALKLK